MVTRDIRTSHESSICDVCGRTLLRGERADVYLNGGTRRSVCELCKTRALHEGWVREGTVPAYDSGDTGADRRRSLFGRLRPRGRPADNPGISAQPTLDDDLDSHAWNQAGGIEFEEPELEALPPESPPAGRRPMREGGRGGSRNGRETRSAAREGRSAGREARNNGRPAARDGGGAGRAPAREPRHVHAVPSSAEHKINAALQLFNGSQHRRTVSGVARSLGAPWVSIQPVAGRPSVVHLVVSWELCWYRYDVDLSDDQPTIRVAGQGYELDELEPAERVANAVADEHGQLSLS